MGVIETIDVEEILDLARKAGDQILEVYNKDFDVEYKGDNSPLTEADKRSNHLIVSFLQERYPAIPLLSEEEKEIDYENRKNWSAFWLIDPLDGTKEFVKKNGDFTVNIALVEDGVPVLGVVYVPVTGDTYYGSSRSGSFRRKPGQEDERLPVNSNLNPEKKLVVVASRSHMSEATKALIESLERSTEQLEVVSVGSSLKLCLVAEGTADHYPRLGPTMEWDTAAAHAVVRGAGKDVYRYAENGECGMPLQYNKENLLNPWFWVK